MGFLALVEQLVSEKNFKFKTWRVFFGRICDTTDSCPCSSSLMRLWIWIWFFSTSLQNIAWMTDSFPCYMSLIFTHETMDLDVNLSTVLQKVEWMTESYSCFMFPIFTMLLLSKKRARCFTTSYWCCHRTFQDKIK